MMAELFLYLAVAMVLMTVGRVVWRRNSQTVDWELIVAFIRLDFPVGQRDLAQKIAAGLAQIVGLKIKNLRPEHTLDEISDWADTRIRTADLIEVLRVAYGVSCNGNTSLRSLVEQAANIQVEKNLDANREGNRKSAP